MRIGRFIQSHHGSVSFENAGTVQRVKPYRRAKLLQAGKSTEKKRIRWVTIKGLDIDDGHTIWEFGPGAFWAQHYDRDEITGIEPIVTDPWVPDRYLVASPANTVGAFAEIGNRNVATLQANAEQALKITKLDSIDGSVISSVLLDSGFINEVKFVNEFSSVHRLSVNSSAGLSDGMWAITGPITPSIELIDFASNGTTKEYVLHAHNNSAGTVTLTTRNGGYPVVLDFDATASEVETAIEAVTGVTSATCSGGPWPWRKIEIEVVWTAASNDFATIAHSGATSNSVFTFGYSFTGGGQRRLTVTPTTVVVGSRFQFFFTLGGVLFEYTATTSHIPTFLSLLAGALNTFIAAQGADGFWFGSTASATGTELRVDYSPGVHPLNVTASGGTGGRPVEGSVTVFDPDTGLIENSIGYDFGFPDGSATWLISRTAAPTVYLGQNQKAAQKIVAAAGNRIVATGQELGPGWIQCWTTGTTWTREWTYDGPGALRTLADSDTVIVDFGRATFITGAGPKTRCGALIVTATGAVTEFDSDLVSLSTADLDHRKFGLTMQDGAPSTIMVSGLHRRLIPQSLFQYHFQGMAAAWGDGSSKVLRGHTIGWNADTVFSRAFGFTPIVKQNIYIRRTIRASSISGSAAKGYTYAFNTEAYMGFNAEAQFRFRFQSSSGGLLPRETAWIDIDATAAEIKAALIAIFPENTEGVVSNIIVNPFGDPPALLHPTSLMERGLEIQFATGPGFVPVQYVNEANTNVIMHVQNTAPRFAGGIVAYNTSDGEELWSRDFGIALNGNPVVHAAGWLKGDQLYLYGPQVESEL